LRPAKKTAKHQSNLYQDSVMNDGESLALRVETLFSIEDPHSRVLPWPAAEPRRTYPGGALHIIAATKQRIFAVLAVTALAGPAANAADTPAWSRYFQRGGDGDQKRPRT
jgi:hypothetical protein